MIDLRFLEQLKGLKQLTLDLSDTQVTDSKLLKQLQKLQSKLSLSISPTHNFEPVEQLNGLTELKLNLYYSRVSNLKSAQKLNSLRTLSIEKATRAQRMSLRNIPASLIELKF